MALVNLSVVEQRYRAVLAVERGEPKIVVAAQFGVSRQLVRIPCAEAEIEQSPCPRKRYLRLAAVRFSAGHDRAMVLATRVRSTSSCP